MWGGIPKMEGQTLLPHHPTHNFGNAPILGLHPTLNTTHELGLAAFCWYVLTFVPKFRFLHILLT